jgi:hypothetical protein
VQTVTFKGSSTMSDKDILLRLKSVCAGLHFGTSLDAVMDAIKEIERLRAELEECRGT